MDFKMYNYVHTPLYDHKTLSLLHMQTLHPKPALTETTILPSAVLGVTRYIILLLLW